ncbi:MAG: ROK family protein [Mycobacterium sp.]
MSTHATAVAGVDIGGTSTEVVLCSPQLEVLARASAATPASVGGAAMIDTCLGLVDALVRATGTRLLGIGVGAAGVVDSQAGTVLVASDSFTAWAGFPVTDTLHRKTGVPVYLDNDVNAFLRGETATGAVAGEAQAFGMTIGTGVGGAVWLHGELFEGLHGAAGEIGHSPGFGDRACTCGGYGHLETLASGRSIAARYREDTGIDLSAAEIAARARRHDHAAITVFDTAGSAIGQAIIMVAALIDITTVVIGGGVAQAWDLLQPAIRRRLTDEPPVSGRPIRLERSALGSDAVALGAASRVRRQLDPC